MSSELHVKLQTAVQAIAPNNQILSTAIETREFPDDTQIIQVNISARLNPKKGGRPPVVVVPHGYGFYWVEAYNAGWTDNVNAQRPGEYPRPLEGFPFENKNQYIYGANRAQLVALAGDGYVSYKPSLDRSKGGNQYYENRDGVDWNLYFYCNDRIDYVHDTYDWYADNAGSANCDFAIFRLPD